MMRTYVGVGKPATILGVVFLAAGCGGGTSPSSSADVASYQAIAAAQTAPTASSGRCSSASNVVGKWMVAANNLTGVPGLPEVKFFSYNQPSVNGRGLLVFRGRAKAPGGSSTTVASGVKRGIFALDACVSTAALYTVAATGTTVPTPNSTDATFSEFPSIPRIDIDSSTIATRGQSSPVWSLPDGTKLGTSGIYVTTPTGFVTAVGQLGAVEGFSYMQVPNTNGVKFDQFPGAPTISAVHDVVFKGNYTDGSISKTGIYYRDLSVAGSPVQMIADTNTKIPGSSQLFGSTAPPSAAGGSVVFTGLDNEDAPSNGGIYIAPIAKRTSLTALVKIGSTVVPDVAGKPLAERPTFTRIGEGLSYDGRFVSFWGAWGTNDPLNMRTVTLTCPTDGNAALIAACLTQYPSGQTDVSVPINQGIFVFDTKKSALYMVAGAGVGRPFVDFLYWTFSGAAGSPEDAGSGTGATDAEPPRWRASAFSTVDGQRGAIFKASRLKGPALLPVTGLYGTSLANGVPDKLFKVLEVGDDMAAVDSNAPTGSLVTALGIERESFRRGWLTITVSSLNAAEEGWAGIYVTNLPGPLVISPASGTSSDLPSLVLG